MPVWYVPLFLLVVLLLLLLLLLLCQKGAIDAMRVDAKLADAKLGDSAAEGDVGIGGTLLRKIVSPFLLLYDGRHRFSTMVGTVSVL